MKALLLMVLAISIALVAAVACGTEEAEPEAAPTTAAAVQPTTAPAAPTTAPAAPTRAAVVQPTAAPAAPAPTKAPVMAMPKGPPVFQVDPRTVGQGASLAAEQELITARGHRGTPCWKGGCGGINLWTYGKVFDFDAEGDLLHYLAASHTVNDDLTLYTVKLREDLVFQDGTPITAADIKAYWEHGAKPENIVAWGGASIALADIKGWNDLRAGEITESEGLVALDDHTLEITLEITNPAFPWLMAFSHSGISKLEQVTSGDSEWSFHPIGAGPYKLTIDPDTNQFEATVEGAEFWGPAPNITKMTGLNVTDTQVKIIMFENGEVSFVGIGADVYREALKPDNPLNPFLVTTPIASLWYVKMKTDLAPVEDAHVRRALAHAVDLDSINTALFGTASTAWATGLISPNIACHNDSPDAGLGYDPDFARQSLAASTYGSADNLPPLIFDMHYPPMINIVVAMKEYWKDNLGVELDLLKRESGMPRREGAQFYRISTASYAPDPLQIISDLTRTDSIEALTPRPGGYPVINALVKTARSLSADDPDRCAAFQAAEQEYLDQVYMIPLRFDLVQTWAVQPWVKGFSSNINQDWHSVPWMYVLEH